MIYKVEKDNMFCVFDANRKEILRPIMEFDNVTGRVSFYELDRWGHIIYNKDGKTYKTKEEYFPAPLTVVSLTQKKG